MGGSRITQTFQSLVANSASNSDFVTDFKLPVPLAALVGLAVGSLIGFINGLIITKTKIEPFMATLGSMIFVKGLLYLFTGGYPVDFQPMPHDFAFIGQGAMLGIPTPVWLFAVVVALLSFPAVFCSVICFGTCWIELQSII